MLVFPGSTNVSVDVRALTTAGAVLTGKVAADFSIWYRRDGAKITVGLSDLAALTTAHTDGGMKEIGDGWYRLDLPDAAFASGANRALFGGSVDGGVVLSTPITILDGIPTPAAIRAEIDANSTQLTAILADTDVIGAAGAGLTAIPWNPNWDTEVQSECADALESYDPPTATEVTAAFTTIKGSGWSGTTDTLKAIRANNGALMTAVPWNPAWDAEVQSECADALNVYDPPTLAELAVYGDAIVAVLPATTIAAAADVQSSSQIASDLLDAPMPPVPVGGSLAEFLVGIDTVVDGASTHSAADVVTAMEAVGTKLTAIHAKLPSGNITDQTTAQAGAAAALTAYDPPTNAEMEARTLLAASYATAAGLADVPTVAEFEARTLVSADYLVVGDLADLPTTSEFEARTLAAADYATATALGDVPTNAELALRTLLAADYATTAAVAALPTAAQIRAEVDSNSTQLAAIVADTGELQAEWADGGRLDLILDAAGVAGDPWIGELPGAYAEGTAGYIVGTYLDAKLSEARIVNIATEGTNISVET